MRIIAKHFTDPCPKIRGFALEFYLILAELFLDFDEIDEASLRLYLRNPLRLDSENASSTGRDGPVHLHLDFRLLGFFAAHLDGFLSHLPRLSVTQKCLVVRLVGVYVSLYLDPQAEDHSDPPEVDSSDKLPSEAKSVLSNLNDDSQSENSALANEQTQARDRINHFLRQMEDLLHLDCFHTKREVFRFFLRLDETDLISKNLSRMVTHLIPKLESGLARRGYFHASKINRRFAGDSEGVGPDWFCKFEWQTMVQCFEFLLEVNERLRQACPGRESVFEDFSEFVSINLADSAYVKILKLKALSTLRNKKNLWLFEREFKKTLDFLDKRGWPDSPDQRQQKMTTRTDSIEDTRSLPQMLTGFCHDTLSSAAGQVGLGVS